MRIVLPILLVVHAIIHLFGFVESFGLLDIKELSLADNPVSGVLWLLSFCLFVATAPLLYFHKHIWRYVLVAGVLVSQALIVIHWGDAKYGSILNVVFLLVAVVGVYGHIFHRQCEKELRSIKEKAGSINFSEKDLESLPAIVRKWIEKSGTLKFKDARYVRFLQDVEMQLKPGQKRWFSGEVEQVFTYNPPAFHWNLKMDIFPMFWIRGRDLYKDDVGSMLILAENIFPLVKVANEDKLNQGSAIRYLAEMALFPCGTLHKDIQWESITELIMKASFKVNGNGYSGNFFFNSNGEFIGFESERFRGSGAEAVLSKWTVRAGNSTEIDGIFIPETLEVTWEMEGQDWTWYKTKIKAIHCNK